MEGETSLLVPLVLSALVAAVVTLAIEYVAKPSLEARKERILRERRHLWDLKEQLGLLEDRLGTLGWLAVEENIELARFEQALDEAMRNIGEIERLLALTEGRLPDAIEEELNFALGAHLHLDHWLSSARQLPEDERPATYARAIKLSTRLLDLPLAYLSTPAWRVLRRRTLVGRTSDLLAALQRDDATELWMRMHSDPE